MLGFWKIFQRTKINDLEIFNAMPKIIDEAFCEDNKVLKAVNYLRKENLSYKFNRVQNKP